MEEFRQAEMVRVSWCLAKSGMPDEWGNTYSLDNWDKQEGTDLNGGSYWFKRCTTYNVFNRPCGKGVSGNQSFEYKINKHNLFWPVPNSAITANNKAELRQNFGYDDGALNVTVETETHVACYAQSTGVIKVTFASGHPNYTIAINGVVETSEFRGGTFRKRGLPAGHYTVNITDAEGAVFTQSVEVMQPDSPLSWTLLQVDKGCAGDANAKVLVRINGGTLPLSGVWLQSQ